MAADGAYLKLHRPPPALLLVPLAALLAVLPLLWHGESCGHDFNFHLLNWMEAAAQLRHGIWHLHWAYTAAWNAGEPRFVFYPPLSWWVGGVLGLLLPWAAVPVVYTWLALVASGIGMFRLAREFTAADEAAVVAAMYVVNPYMLFTALERTAYAELLAAAWIPLALSAILARRVRVLGVALPVALLWLTNAPAAVMGCYALALVAAVRVVAAGTVRKALDLAGRSAAGVALGLGLAAFYVVPAAYERRWVEIAMVMVPGMRIADSFLFRHTADAAHDEVLRTASWIAVGMLVAAGAMLAAVWRRRALRESVVALAALTAGLGLMLTPLSASLWRVLPEMQFLQFPWRLVMVLGVVVGAGAAMALGEFKVRSGWLLATGIVAVVMLSLWAWRPFYQWCDDADTVSARAAVFADGAGSEPTDEYTPKDADNEALGHTNPAWWLSEDADAAAPLGATPGIVPMRFAVETPQAEMLVLNLRAYPAWSVTVNGAPVVLGRQRADGLIAVAVPKGPATVTIAYRRTPDETAGIAVSAMAALLAGVLGVLRQRRVSYHLH